VIAAESSCIANDILGELIVMRLYEKKRVMELMAKDVMGAEADEERITCKKGWRNEGESNVFISLHPARSLLSCPNADKRGLSCMLFPFWPRSPQRFARVGVPPPLTVMEPDLAIEEPVH
jgi:hypothetical protein